MIIPTCIVLTRKIRTIGSREFTRVTLMFMGKGLGGEYLSSCPVYSSTYDFCCRCFFHFISTKFMNLLSLPSVASINCDGLCRYVGNVGKIKILTLFHPITLQPVIKVRHRRTVPLGNKRLSRTIFQQCNNFFPVLIKFAFPWPL